MKLKIFFILVFTYVSLVFGFSQSKKEVKKNKIKSISEFISVMENGKPVSYQLSYIVFDKNGNTIENIEYNKDGSLKKKETCKYDSDNNKMEETCYSKKESKEPKSNSENKVENTKTVYKYNANKDRIEDCEYDGTSGKLIRKQVYSYDKKGNKCLEETYNDENKLTKKIVCTFNNKGLKTKKEHYNEKGDLEVTKKYVYEF